MTITDYNEPNVEWHMELGSLLSCPCATLRKSIFKIRRKIGHQQQPNMLVLENGWQKTHDHFLVRVLKKNEWLSILLHESLICSIHGAVMLTHRQNISV